MNGPRVVAAAGIDEKATDFEDYELVVGGIDSSKGACEKKQMLEGRVARFYYENPQGRGVAGRGARPALARARGP